MPDAQITWTANATQMLAEYKRLEDARRKEDQQLQAIKRQNDEVAKSERASNREAAQIKERHMPALERYTKEKERLNGLVARNKITQQEANLELERQRKIIEQTDGAAGGLSSKLGGITKQALESFTGIGSVLAGIMAAASALKQEAEDAKRRNEQSKLSQLSFGDAIRSMAINFSGDDTLSLDGLEKRMMRAAQKTGATPEAVAQAASVAFSARGHLPAETAMQAVEAALRLNPNDSSGAANVAGRSLDIIASGIGINDPRAAASFITQLQQTARVTDIGRLGKEFIPAINAGMLRGDTIETSSERLIQLNQMMKDQEGSQSATAFTNLTNRLAKFVPQSAAADARGEFTVPQAAIDAFGAAGSTDARINVMNQFPELQRAFLAKNSFEAAAQAPIEQILSGGDAAQFALGKARTGVSSPSAAEFESFVGAREAMPSQIIASAQRAFAASLKRFEIGDVSGGEAGFAQDVLDQTLEKVDFFGPDFINRAVVQDNVAGRVMQGQSRRNAVIDELTAIRQSASASDDPRVVTLLQDAVGVLRNMDAATGGPPENALGRQ